MKKLTQQEDYNMENVQIYREVGRAEKEYLACKAALDLAYSQHDCAQNWQEYGNCSARMDKMRLKLEHLAEEEGSIRGEAAKVMRMPNASLSALDLAKRIYNDSMKRNEQRKTDLAAKLDLHEGALRHRIFERDEAL